MSNVIFACDAKNYLTRQTEYRGPDKQEYYEGDYRILPGAHVDVCIEKGLSCAYPIINLRTRGELWFRRTWDHIRQDKTDVTIVWFVRRGRIAVSNASGRSVIETGECTITRSLHPFFMENLVDNESMNEVLHVVVPTHVSRSFIPDSISSGAAFSFRQGDCRVAERTFSMLYDEGEDVDRDVAEDLIRAALGAVGHSMSESMRCAPSRSLGERRYKDILAFIQKNLSNPDLTSGSVAHGCGISSRYLYHILQTHGTSFADVMWEKRLERTRNWLTAPNMSHVTIAEIAYMAGFKSPAHFSRMFKRMTNATPRDFRESAATSTNPPDRVEFDAR
jgi:AraC family transcriptional regulator, positive regulator of tynA and feaB